MMFKLLSFLSNREGFRLWRLRQECPSIQSSCYPFTSDSGLCSQCDGEHKRYRFRSFVLGRIVFTIQARSPFIVVLFGCSVSVGDTPVLQVLEVCFHCLRIWRAFSDTHKDVKPIRRLKMFVGQLGSLELAGASIACVGVQDLAYGIMLGMASAVQTVCGQAYGAKKYASLGIICQKAIILHLGAAILLSFLYWFSGSFLKAIGQSSVIVEQGQIFC